MAMSEFVDVRTNTKVEYCQGFNFIAAFALLFLAEEEAFWYSVPCANFVIPTKP